MRFRDILWCNGYFNEIFLDDLFGVQSVSKGTKVHKISITIYENEKKVWKFRGHVDYFFKWEVTNVSFFQKELSMWDTILNKDLNVGHYFK